MGNFSGTTDNQSQNQQQEQEQQTSNSQPSNAPSKSKGRNKIELATSVLGGSGPFTAYHTSVLINGREYFFDMGGVMSTSNLLSHKGKQQFTQVLIGYTNKTASGMERTLRQYFAGGTYDLLRKNCNSFSDCALFYLCRERLPSNYNRMEKLGNSEMFGSLMQSGEYKPNAKADDFDKEKVLETCRGVFEKTQGMSVGGQNVESKQDMKAKRLAMLEKKMAMK
eukprot:863331_1